MLGIPFLQNYIQSVVKEQTVADNVDWLNYYVTSMMLAFFSLMISAKQYFGSPIQCWNPSEFTGSWSSYAEQLCFIQSSYYVPFENEIPTDAYSRRDQVTYYRWVPIVLALQAIFFFLPNWLWNMCHKQTTVNPRSIVAEVRKSVGLNGKAREEEIDGLAHHISDVLGQFNHNCIKKVSTAQSGYNATATLELLSLAQILRNIKGYLYCILIKIISAMYLCTKLCYVINAVGQLLVLNHFLGGDYLSWGFQTMFEIARGEGVRESEIFPRVIMCDFKVRNLGQNQAHSVQCVIMMNMINEKLYLFLYFWLIGIAFLTTLNFLYYLIIMSIPSLRANQAISGLKKEFQTKRDYNHRVCLDRFVHKFLRPDGVLLLIFIRNHIGGRVTFDLTNAMYKLYKENGCLEDNNTSNGHKRLLGVESNGSNSTQTTNTPEKRPIHFPQSPKLENEYEIHPETYKSTPYNPTRLLPTFRPNPSAPSVTYPNIPSIDDVDHHNMDTLKLSDINTDHIEEINERQLSPSMQSSV
uniref:Innexin n=1 Tax=Rhabditophanes sp. KR3021 TaxID=114890 RepID=A0AC35UI57_9BILA